MPVVIGGDILSSPGGVGLTDLPNIGGASGSPGPPSSGTTVAGCVMAHPDFGRSVNPISNRQGTDYANLITNGTPEFSDLPTALGVYTLIIYWRSN